MADANPYAPPEEASGRPAPVRAATPESGDIAAAIERLNRHLADPGSVSADSAAIGGRLRGLTWTAMVITLALGGGVGYGVTLEGQGGNVLAGICGFLGVIFLISFIVALVNDLLLKPRAECTSAQVALESWLRAMRLGRAGYVYASLCPTAREAIAPAPDLRPVVTADMDYPLDSPAGVARWLKSFARPGTGHVRWMKVKSVRAGSEQGDVATAESTVFFRSWPNWANILSVVLFLFIRFIGLIVAVILWYSNRRQTTIQVEKTLIRGRDGLWYVLDASIAVGERAGQRRARAAANT
jgi:hypothetical protein